MKNGLRGIRYVPTRAAPIRLGIATSFLRICFYLRWLNDGFPTNNHIECRRDVLSMPVSKKCKKIILCHNHPSGNLEPSEADIAFTERMEKAAAIMKIELLDHIIITEVNYVTI